MAHDGFAPVKIPFTPDQQILSADDLRALSIRSLLYDAEGSSYRLISSLTPPYGRDPSLIKTSVLGVTSRWGIEHPHLFRLGPLILVWTPDSIPVELPNTALIVTGPHGYVPETPPVLGKVRPLCEICGRAYWDGIHTLDVPAKINQLRSI